MSDKEFDKKFQESFENFEVEPSKALWSSLEARLESKKSRKRIPLFWMAAASVTVIFISGLYLFQPKSKIWLRNENDILAKTKPAPKNQQAEALQLPIQKKEEMVEVVSKDVKPNFYKPIRKVKMHVHDAGSSTEEVIAIEKIAAKVETHESHSPDKVAIVAMPDQKAISRTVSLVDSGTESREIIVGRPRIKSVGDLVNFVIAKVDQREDKIIEMSDNDEGSSISAINLGVLKIKSVKNKAPREFKVNFK